MVRTKRRHSTGLLPWDQLTKRAQAELIKAGSPRVPEHLRIRLNVEAEPEVTFVRNPEALVVRADFILAMSEEQVLAWLRNMAVTAGISPRFLILDYGHKRVKVPNPEVIRGNQVQSKHIGKITVSAAATSTLPA